MKTLARASRAFPVLLAVALVAAAAPAALASTAPAYQAPRPVSRTLANGLVVHFFEDHDLPTVYYRMLVKAGGINEPAEKAGLANLTTLVMRQGTGTLTAPELSRQVDRIGGQLYLDADRDYTIAGAQSRRGDHLVVLGLLADVLMNPAFLEAEVVRQKSQVQAAIRQSLDDPETVVGAHFDALVHGEHPYARPPQGDELSVGGLSRADLVAFHQTYFRPNNAALAITGDLTADEAFAAAEKAFGGWAQGEIPPRVRVPQKPLAKTKVRVIDREDLTQSQIRIGYVGLPRTTPDYFPMLVMNYILGGGGFASRMTAEVRSKAGLSYDARTVWVYGADPGTFMISTFTKNESVKQAIDTAFDVVRKFRDEGPTPTELEQAKAYYVGAFPFGLQTPALVAESWLRTQYFGLGDDYLDRYRERVQAVTAADVHRAAKSYLRTEWLAIAVVGRGAAVDSQLVGYGEIERTTFTARTGAIPEVMPAAVPASAPDTPESRKAAVAVVAKAVKAHGGRAALAAVKDWRSRGAISLSMAGQQLDGEFIEISVPPSRRRMEMVVYGQSMVQVLNGESGFSVTGGRSIPMEDDQLEAMKMGGYNHPVRLLLTLSDPKTDIRFAGEREIFGKKVEAIEWIRPDGRPAHVAFAADTGLLHVLEQPELSATGGSWTAVHRVYEDYRTSGTLVVPFKTTVYSGGEKAVEQSLAQVEWNVGADPKLFAPAE